MHSLAGSWVGYVSLAAFVVAYLLVIFEEKLHLRKSKPVILIGCLLWALIAFYEAMHGAGGHGAEAHVKELLVEIAELFFFILVAMTLHKHAPGEARVRVAQILAHQKGVQLQDPFLDNRRNNLLPVGRCRQPHERPSDGDGRQRGKREQDLHSHLVRQHNRGGKRRGCVEPVRRHNDPDGLDRAQGRRVAVHVHIRPVGG